MHAIFFERMLSIFFFHWFVSHSLPRSFSLSLSLYHSHSPFLFRWYSWRINNRRSKFFLHSSLLLYFRFAVLFIHRNQMCASHSHMNIAWSKEIAEKNPTRPINRIWLSLQIKQYRAIYSQWKGGKECFFCVYSERTYYAYIYHVFFGASAIFYPSQSIILNLLVHCSLMHINRSKIY